MVWLIVSRGHVLSFDLALTPPGIYQVSASAIDAVTGQMGASDVLTLMVAGDEPASEDEFVDTDMDGVPGLCR